MNRINRVNRNRNNWVKNNKITLLPMSLIKIWMLSPSSLLMDKSNRHNRHKRQNRQNRQNRDSKDNNVS